MPTSSHGDNGVVKSNGFVKNGTYEQVNVIRQYINPAIYVENDVFDLEKRPLVFKYSSHELHAPKIVKVKSCTCALDHGTCSFHNFSESSEEQDSSETNTEEYCEQTCEKKPSYESVTANYSSCTNGSQSHRDVASLQCSPSVKSLRHGSACSMEERKADAAFQEWLERKKKQQREDKLAEARAREMLAQEREIAKNKERQNFKQWLAQKKAEEDRIRLEKELRVEDERRKQMEEEIRAHTNKLKYQLWLKEKEKEVLEKKLEQELILRRQRVEKERRTEENAKAYEVWLRNSKNKPKPVPMNQGLLSLKSSVSVSYVNPNPWKPNVDPKPASQ